MRGVPQRSKHTIVEGYTACGGIQPSPKLFCERGLLTAIEMEPSAGCQRTTNSGNRELAFLGDPFECLSRAFNAILTIVAIGRQQPDHLIGAGGGRTGNIAGSKIDSLSNGVLVLQRPLHTQERRPRSWSH
jgi:hypothetical protein